MNILINYLVFILGMCLGSFLNVCIWRLPKDMSIVSPRSFCPKCKAPIRAYDNIPIVSYICLLGRCRRCRERIPLRYPLVELIAGIILFSLYVKFGFSLQLIKFAFLFSLLIVVSFIDIDYHAIPGYLCVLGIVAGLVFSALESGGFLNILMDAVKITRHLKAGIFDASVSPFIESFIGLLFGLGFAYLFKLFGDIFISLLLYLRKRESIEGEKESLGLGDVDFMGMVGVFLGIKAVVMVFFLAPFIAVGYSIFAVIFKRSHLIPYLPYLSLATLVVFFWQDKILGFIF